jgi:hypothetical protein
MSPQVGLVYLTKTKDKDEDEHQIRSGFQLGQAYLLWPGPGGEKGVTVTILDVTVTEHLTMLATIKGVWCHRDMSRVDKTTKM